VERKGRDVAAAKTVLEVNKLLKRRGTHRVSDNLYLQVRPSLRGGLRASWMLRYWNDGKAHWMGLGKASLLSLAEARERARKQLQLRLDGLDPLEAKQAKVTAAMLEAAKGITFKECADKYIAAHSAGWKNAKHAAQWVSTFYATKRGSRSFAAATAAINDLPVGKIDTALVLKCLEPIWTKTPETASRVRQRIEAVLDWAKAREYRDGENPARWTDHLKKLLPEKSKLRKVKHHPALPYDDLPAFMAELRANTLISARALEFTILTAARTIEVIGAKRDEIDFMAETWTVPAHRMKAGKEHKVPLSDRVLEILSAVPRDDGNPHLFIGARNGLALSHMAMLALVKRMRPGYVPHGFRSTFRDWASERTSFAREVAEMALAHVIGDKTEAAYRRGDLFEKRRRLMADWARFCASPVTAAPHSNVIPVRERAR
jgi:integrase